MTIGEDESLEDYEERFHLSYKWATWTLDPESLKLVLFRGVRDDILDTLHMLVGGDIYQLPYEDIRLSLETILGKLGKMVGVVNLWLIHHLPTHTSRVKLEIWCRTSKVSCCKPLPCNWTPWTSEGSNRKKKEPWPSFVLDEPGGILGMNVHWTILIFARFVKKTTPQKTALIYPNSKLYMKELKWSLTKFSTLTKRELLGLDHTSRVCKGHPMHIKNQTKP